jgi:Endonuclease-reverse transcriptase
MTKPLLAATHIAITGICRCWPSGDDNCLRLATPDSYAFVDIVRYAGRGGGVAVIFWKHLTCSRVALPVCGSMKVLCVRLTTADNPLVILNVYRSGSERPSATFYDELTSILEFLIIYSCPVIIGGDFNMRVQDVDDIDSRRLSDLLTSFDMRQYVQGPTHRCGNTLDLVVTPADRCPDAVAVDPPGVISGHALIIFRMLLNVDQPPSIDTLARD